MESIANRDSTLVCQLDLFIHVLRITISATNVHTLDVTIMHTVVLERNQSLHIALVFQSLMNIIRACEDKNLDNLY